MKRNFLMMALVCLFTVVAISSCKKDDDDENGGNGVIKNNTITAKVVNGLGLDADVVKLEIEYENSNGREETYVAANAHYINGGFKLELPENVNDMYLSAFGEEIDFPDGLTVSNRNVKFSVWDDGRNLYAYKSNNCVGCFYHGIADWGSSLVYANGDVSITGTYDDTYTDPYNGKTEIHTQTYNIHLKKGWNIVYEVDNMEEGYKVTTTAPSGAEWCWY